jgi:acetyl esterase/lipase
MKKLNIILLSISLKMLMACALHATEGVTNETNKSVIYGQKSGMALTMDVTVPSEDANGAGIVIVLSGGWYSWWQDAYPKPWSAEAYANAGYTVFTVRHGSSPKFSIEEAVSDLKRAVRYIRSHAKSFEIDPEKIGVTGMSSGGHLALMLGLNSDEGNVEAMDPVDTVSSRVGAVAALVPPTDLRPLIWSASAESAEKYGDFPALDISEETAQQLSPVEWVSKDDAPTLIYMAEIDVVVPATHGEWLKEAMKKKGLDFEHKVFPGVGHEVGLENFTVFEEEAIAWFDKKLF